MEPIKYRHPLLQGRRNRGGFLLGGSWVHDSAWPQRLIHIYAGFWVVTVALKGNPHA